MAIGLYSILAAGVYWYSDLWRFVTLYLFIGLGFGFLVVGIWMVITVKKYFPPFYESAGSKLIGATLLLSIPMYLRGINWFCQINIDSYKQFYDEWIAYTNAIYAILTTILPVVAQMSSLIFGALKDQKDSSRKRQSSYITLRESNQVSY